MLQRSEENRLPEFSGAGNRFQLHSSPTNQLSARNDSPIAVREIKLDIAALPDETQPGYVTRRFNASLAGLKKPVGLDLRWKAALRDLQIQLEPRVHRSEAAVQSASRGWFLVQRGTGLQLM
jgi:hypothetical protein